MNIANGTDHTVADFRDVCGKIFDLLFLLLSFLIFNFDDQTRTVFSSVGLRKFVTNVQGFITKSATKEGF